MRPTHLHVVRPDELVDLTPRPVLVLERYPERPLTGARIVGVVLGVLAGYGIAIGLAWAVLG